MAAQPGLRPRDPVSLAGRHPDDRISLTAFCAEVAHTNTWWMFEMRRRGDCGFPRAGADSRYRLGDLASFFDAAAAVFPVHLRDPAIVEMGRQLAAARRGAGLSQRGLGAKAGYSRSTISDMEGGIEPGSAAAWEAVDQALGTGGRLTHCVPPGSAAACRKASAHAASSWKRWAARSRRPG